MFMTTSVLALGANLANAQALQVAVEEPAPPPVASASPAPASAAHRDQPSDEKPKHSRDKTVLGGSMYVTTGMALDDVRNAGFDLRIALDLYASIGLGDGSLLLGGTVLGAEFTVFENRKSVGIPALFTVGFRDDSWLVAVDSGATLGFDNSYNDFDDDETSLPSPRVQLRAGYRINNFQEIAGVVGYERQLYENRDGVDRLLVGVAVGIGGDG